jgi:hypothetical protein
MTGAWAGFGAYVWNRNRPPSASLDDPRKLPQGNAYDEVVGLVHQVKETGSLSLLERAKGTKAKPDEEILAANRAVLGKIHAAVAKPSAVKSLEVQEGFVAAIDFPNVTALLAVDANSKLRSNPRAAAESLLDGLRYCEAVSRDGAGLHLIMAFLSSMSVFEAFPAVIEKLTRTDALEVAREVDGLLASRTPLADYVAHERWVKVRAFAMGYGRNSTRIFKLDMPQSDMEWSYLMKPKLPLVEEIEKYFQAWTAIALAPGWPASFPEQSQDLQDLASGQTFDRQMMSRTIVRHRYIASRMAIVSAALKLRAYRVQSGRYPERLEEALGGARAEDAFTGSALIYRRAGTGYTLYSAGPNAKDDGGKPYQEGKLDIDTEGDLLVQPKLLP